MVDIKQDNDQPAEHNQGRDIDGLFKGWGEITKELVLACKRNSEDVKELTSIVKVMLIQLSALETIVEHKEDGDGV